MIMRLWFGDERGYNATIWIGYPRRTELWFGDERGYNATVGGEIDINDELWFGDERGYNATPETSAFLPACCGLVMKEDITQPIEMLYQQEHSCGLVMKEDITQR